MRPLAQDADHLLDLADIACEENASDNEFAELDSLLLDDQVSRNRYLNYCRIHVALKLHLRASRATQMAQQRINVKKVVPTVGDCNVETIAMPCIVPVNTLPTIHSPFSYLPESWLVAYLIATVIFGIAGLIGAFTYVSHHTQVAERLPGFTRKHVATEPQMESVGQITGMVDCQWADKSTAVVNGAHVPLARKYALASGLMKITYDSGAEVILQGPVTYEVESKNGGYLSIGKLTGEVEVETAKGFSVRTPTAIVTDLGTEFAVEVNTLGNTTSHVYRGSVKLEMASTEGEREPTPHILYANESAQVEKESGNGRISIHSIKVDPARFVRPKQLPQVLGDRQRKSFRRWQAYSEELRKDPSLLAYYDFQRRKDSPEVLRNVAANEDHSFDGRIMNATWVNGRMAGKHALRFRSRADWVEVDLSRTVDDLTLAAWVQVESLPDPSMSEYGYSGLLMSNGWNTGNMHWQVRSDGRMCFAACGGCLPFQTEPSFDEKRWGLWTHSVLAYDHNAQRTQFYVNGKMVEEMATPNHVPIQIGPAWIGHWNGRELGRNLLGRIDEMAIFSRPLAAEEIQCMYEAGNPVVGIQK